MRIFARVAALAVIALVLISGGIWLFVDANQFRPLLESELTRALGRPVKVGDLKLSIFSGGIIASNLSVAEDPAFGGGDFVHAQSLAVAVQLLPLIFSRQVDVTGLTIKQPQITLAQAASGKWNFSSIGGAASTPPNTPPAQAGKSSLRLSANRITLSNARVTITRAHSPPQAFDDVNVEIRDFAPTAAVPFVLTAHLAGGGEASLQGKVGPINSADAAITPVQAAITVKHLDLVAAGFMKRSSGFGGLLSVDANGSSDGNTLRASGHLKADALKLLPHAHPAGRSVQFDFALTHDLAKRAGSISRGDIRIGTAQASLTGGWTLHDDDAILAMKLAGDNMSIQELEAMLPALDIVLPAGSSLRGGSAHAALAIEGPTDGLITSGTVGLNNTRLAGFDLASRMKTAARLAGIKTGPDTDIQTFSANVRIAPEGKSLEDIVVIAPAIGDLSGGGTVTPERALDFRMLVKLHTSGVVMALAGQRGDTEVPFHIGGTSSAPTFTPEIKGVMGAEVNTVMKSDQAAKSAVGLVKGIFGGKKK